MNKKYPGNIFELSVGITICAPVCINPLMVFAINPLNATNDMKMASAITSAIDHFEDSSAKKFASRFRSKAGLYKQNASVKILIAGKTTLNISTSTPTIHISGRPIVTSVRNTSSTLLLWK